jgi:hypothetical protein
VWGPVPPPKKRTGWVRKRDLFLKVQKADGLRLRCQYDEVLVRIFLQLAYYSLLTVSSHVE